MALHPGDPVATVALNHVVPEGQPHSKALPETAIWVEVATPEHKIPQTLAVLFQVYGALQVQGVVSWVVLVE